MVEARQHAVLVVDDDPSMRGILSLWVRGYGFDVLETASAEEALDRLAQRPVEVAVCDVRMQGRSGVWLAEQLRERFPSTAVVMATSAREVDICISSLQNEVVDYLLKPFDRTRFGEALSLALDWHRGCAGGSRLHEALQDRLRSRRARVAGAVAEAQTSTELALHGLVSMLQLHQRDALGHATRVARLAVSLADELDADETLLLDVERGALLHDVGKLELPAELLAKPALLTADEWQMMRTHPEVGYELVRRLPGLGNAAALIRAHHEAFDGSGYPRGLKGFEIPLGARILTVADSFDSMTHPHTQRPSMPPALAVHEIERCRGTQFDPQVAEALGGVLANAARECVPARLR